MKSPADYFKPPIQSTGLQILIIERQCTNVFIKIDRIPEAFFRLFHAVRNARITGKVENDHGRTAAHFELAMWSKTPKRTSLESFAGGPMKPDRDSGGTRPALALCPGKIGSAGNEGSAINVYFSHLEAMRADGQQSEQSPSHFLWTSIKYESKYVMSQKVVRSSRADSPYESRAETEAAVERIHERFRDIRAAIAKEKAQKTSAAADSHPRPRGRALEPEGLQQSLGALTEARDSLNAACKIFCISIDTVSGQWRPNG